ncbi:MAG: hypothetical protein KDG44_00425 [Burkholderiaceae bacterium]|nr:hypothetical protein [Burkholderiaceae bacterium]
MRAWVADVVGQLALELQLPWRDGITKAAVAIPAYSRVRQAPLENAAGSD